MIDSDNNNGKDIDSSPDCEEINKTEKSEKDPLKSKRSESPEKFQNKEKLNGNKRKENGIKELDSKLNEKKEDTPIPSTPSADSTSRLEKKEVECIDLDDDDDDIQEVKIQEPPIKRAKKSPVPEDPKNSSQKEESKPIPAKSSSIVSNTPNVTASSSNILGKSAKKEPELTSYSALLDRLETYIQTAIEKNENVERKVLDALLAAINVQVQKEPYSVRKLILDKQLVLPNTISFPPSQVVELLIEHDPDHQLSRVITKMFGEERPKLLESERRERQMMRNDNPALNMTKLLMDIGQDLVQESTYSDIVHARNLPEIPKNMETYRQVAAQLKPVWENLRKKNEPLKLSYFTCQVCNFKTDSRTVLSIHRQTPHYAGRKYQCALCPEFDTNENRINRHYIEAHRIKPIEREDLPSKVQCPICDEDFNFKGHRDAHLKMCKRDINKTRTLQASRAPEHIGMINRWLWDKPPAEPSIVAQQQDLQKQQLRQQQQLLIQQQRIAAAAAAQNAQQSNRIFASAAHQQLLAQQQRLKNSPFGATRQLGQLMRNGTGNFTPQMIQQAMQAQMKQQQQQQMQQKAAALNRIASSSLTKQQIPQKGRTPTLSRPNPAASGPMCEICDQHTQDKEHYLSHLQNIHKQLRNKTTMDMSQGPPLACSRCRDRFHTYEGLERHLVMGHGLVTSDLLQKAQRKEDGGRCKICGKQYAFNMLQHLVSDHDVKLCSAEIMYSCDVCAFKCSYQRLETHLSEEHPKATNPAAVKA